MLSVREHYIIFRPVAARHSCPTFLPDILARHSCPTFLPVFSSPSSSSAAGVALKARAAEDAQSKIAKINRRNIFRVKLRLDRAARAAASPCEGSQKDARHSQTASAKPLLPEFFFRNRRKHSSSAAAVHAFLAEKCCGNLSSRPQPAEREATFGCEPPLLSAAEARARIADCKQSVEKVFYFLLLFIIFRHSSSVIVSGLAPFGRR